MSENAPIPGTEKVLPESEAWKDALELNCRLTFGLPVPKFTVRDLLRLAVQSVIDTTRPESTDVAVQLNGRLIGWAEFEVVNQNLAFRFTELEDQ
jgi:flagellar motor switch/type III secretory pathway protein FliN